jgi:glycosyltransferase involved in cell wall biosynthesis
MEMETPLVSIITPCYNSEKYIQETIQSVRQQTYTNWEHIIVDDASKDGSIILIEDIKKLDSRIRVISLKENQGAAYCRNLATMEAKGRFLAFLDSDDLWFRDKLKRQLAFMKERNCDVSYTSYLLINEEGNSLQKRILARPILTYKKQLYNNYIGNLSGMYDAEKLGKVLSPEMRKRQDWAVWLEAIKRSGKPAAGLQEDLAYYRVRKNSISSDKLTLVKYNYQFYRDHLKFSNLKSMYSLSRFFWEYFLVRTKYIRHLK